MDHPDEKYVGSHVPCLKHIKTFEICWRSPRIRYVALDKIFLAVWNYNETTSNGGTATWNGRTLQGEKVTTGVYLIWTAPNDPEVKGRKVGKVLVVN